MLCSEVRRNTENSDKGVTDDAIDEVLYGSDERIKIKSSLIGTSSDYFVTYEGVVKYIQMLQEKDASATAQKWAEQFAKTTVCPECKGARLNKEALHFRIHDKNINELANMDINELYDWLRRWMSSCPISRRKYRWRF